MDEKYLTYHVLESLRGAVAEIEEDEDMSRRIREQTRLRFANMSDNDLWELALLAASPQHPVEFIFLDYLKDRERLAAAIKDVPTAVNG